MSSRPSQEEPTKSGQDSKRPLERSLALQRALAALVEESSEEKDTSEEEKDTSEEERDKHYEDRVLIDQVSGRQRTGGNARSIGNG